MPAESSINPALHSKVYSKTLILRRKVVSGLAGQKAARLYFWFLGFFYAADVITYAIRHWTLISPLTNLLVNLPHVVISTAAFLIAINVDKKPVLDAAVSRP
jgi:hypothetical protein